ncbi:MAG: hypothetical protein GY941_25215 [Planctomycetes bacterium]|nr:hypothetical protein [Planctomycetota bacterium]
MLILPAFGLINESIVKYSQCIIYGRDSMIVAMILISFIGSIV